MDIATPDQTTCDDGDPHSPKKDPKTDQSSHVTFVLFDDPVPRINYQRIITPFHKHLREISPIAEIGIRFLACSALST